MALNGSMPHSDLMLLPGQSHRAIGMAPELFTAEILNFLRPSSV
jgi:hypothetical protein